MSPAWLSRLPSGIDPQSVITCLGLISDTHMPERCAALPASLTDVFCEVDMILHAGDVGELWVLDQLSTIAPVIAVHGNDELSNAQSALPYEQVIFAGGQRILLCHTHDPDRAAELELRKEDRWAPNLARLAKFTKRSQASILVFGHSHIPMVIEQDGVLLINPGAIASGSLVSRQVYQTAALLFVRRDQKPIVVHFDLAKPDHPFDVTIDWEAGFNAARSLYNTSLFDADVATRWPPIEMAIRRMLIDRLTVPMFNVFFDLLLETAHRHWADGTSTIDRAELLALLDKAGANPIVPAELISEFRQMLE